MKRKIKVLLVALIISSTVSAQYQVVQNRPYTDLRTFHFGVTLGTHVQDIELKNVGPQNILYPDGTTKNSNISVEQDRWDAGFHVGVLGELSLSTHFQLRVAPTMYFGTRHLILRNEQEHDIIGKMIEQRQELKTAYISTPTELIFAAKRVNNHRPYILLGFNPMINLSGKESDYIKLKRYDAFAEIGIGCDFYLPFFKLRPELKFMYSLINSIDGNHINKIKAENMIPYTHSVRDARTKMIALSFYFE
jgi:hypothetical protein